VLYRSGDDVFAGRIDLERGIDGRVIRFSSATRENDLTRLAPKQKRNPFARPIDCLPHLAGKLVTARRIAVKLRQERQHLLHHRGIELCGSVVIDVNDFACYHNSTVVAAVSAAISGFRLL
jgi:hypothetical protein